MLAKTLGTWVQHNLLIRIFHDQFHFVPEGSPQSSSSL